MTIEETKKTIAFHASGKYAEFVNNYAETSGGLLDVKDNEFFFVDGTSLDFKPKSLFERWDEEAKIIAERGGY
jgi:hypothetical protein